MRARSRVGFLAVILFLVAVGLVVSELLSSSSGETVLTTEPTASTVLAPERGNRSFETTVGPAVDALGQGSAFQAIQTNFVNQFVASAIWMDARPNGDSFVMQTIDVDVLKGGWWLTGDTPSSQGRRTETILFVHAGNETYVGEGDGTWNRIDQPSLTPEFLLGTPLEGRDVSRDAQYTVEETEEGGELWSVSQPYQGGTLKMKWRVSEGGVLESYSGEMTGVDLPHPDDPHQQPINNTQIDFKHVEESEPISAPQPGESVDISMLKIPDGFPLDP